METSILWTAGELIPAEVGVDRAPAGDADAIIAFAGDFRGAGLFTDRFGLRLRGFV